MTDVASATTALTQWCNGAPRIAVALSGGVDSMTLAVLVHRSLGAGKVRMCHAVSPAVPSEATQRVRRYADSEGWALDVFEAGEFEDPRYMKNPVNRCYFCKTNLYATLAARNDALLVSGTNTDDMGDYRPGLHAAEEHGVRHPYVECGVDKAMVRAIAHALDLHDVAELPAAPCLSSRVETGIEIEPKALLAINAVEKHLRDQLSPKTVRCRLRSAAIVIELDADSHAALDDVTKAQCLAHVSSVFAQAGIKRTVNFSPYRMGSAFLRVSPQ